MPEVIEQLRRYGEAAERRASAVVIPDAPPARRRSRRLIAAVAAAVLVAVTAAGVAIVGTGDDDGPNRVQPAQNPTRTTPGADLMQWIVGDEPTAPAVLPEGISARTYSTFALPPVDPDCTGPVAALRAMRADDILVEVIYGAPHPEVAAHAQEPLLRSRPLDNLPGMCGVLEENPNVSPSGEGGPFVNDEGRSGVVLIYYGINITKAQQRAAHDLVKNLDLG